KGRCYVSDGSSHIIDFSVNGVEPGVKDSKLSLNGKKEVTINAKVTAYLSSQQDESGLAIAQSPMTSQPYWNIERARIGKTQKVSVQLIVNGVSVDTLQILADGLWKDV